jgi:hypothetical protein
MIEVRVEVDRYRDVTVDVVEGKVWLRVDDGTDAATVLLTAAHGLQLLSGLIDALEEIATAMEGK